MKHLCVTGVEAGAGRKNQQHTVMADVLDA